MPCAPLSLSARARRAQTPARLGPLALLLSAACGAAPPPELNLARVPVAEAVPDSTFDAPTPSALAAHLACTPVDPTGRSLTTRRAVVRVGPAQVWVGDQPVAPTAALFAADAGLDDRAGGLLDTLRALRFDHEQAVALYPCAPPFTGAVLIEAPADLPFGALKQVVRAAAGAGYGELWLRVAADTLPTEAASPPAPRRPRAPPWEVEWLTECSHSLGITWEADGAPLVVWRGSPAHDPDEVNRYYRALYPTEDAAPETTAPIDLAQLRARLPPLPAWADAQVALHPPAAAPLSELVTAMTAVRAAYGPRTLIGTGDIGLSPPHPRADPEGPRIAALPYVLAPSCVMPPFEETTCLGLDGVERPRHGAPVLGGTL